MQFDLSDPTEKTPGEKIIEAFQDEIDGYLYSRFGD